MSTTIRGRLGSLVCGLALLAGGIVGSALYWASSTLFSTAGAHIACIFGVLGGLLLITGTSLSSIGRVIVEGLELGRHWAARQFQRLSHAVAGERARVRAGGTELGKVVVVDVEGLGDQGAGWIATARAESPAAGILLLVHTQPSAVVQDLMQRGAAGYVEISRITTDLVAALLTLFAVGVAVRPAFL